MIIGLTGSIASGKSTVAKYLSELGAKVIDADQVARNVVQPNTPALKELVNSFGPGILNNDQTLNRQKLATIVFKDSDARKTLENITHPRIEEEINREIRDFASTHPHGNLVLEVPLLIEVGWHKKVDQVWLVTVNEREQLNRLIKRDKLSLEQALDRIKSQMPQQEKAKYADVLIENSGSSEDMRKRVKEIWDTINSDSSHQ